MVAQTYFTVAGERRFDTLNLKKIVFLQIIL